MIDCEKAKIISMSDENLKASLLTPNIGNLALFRCEKNDKICKQTYGYLASTDIGNEKKYYSFDISSSNGNIVDFTSEPSCSNDTDVGKLQKNGELCLKNDNSNPIKHSITESNIYSISTKSTSIFSKVISDKNIIIRSNGKAFFLDNYYKEKGVNLFVSYMKSATSVVKDNISKTILCICNREGICTSIKGYIKIENNYYSIEASEQETKNKLLLDEKFRTECSSSNDGGQLLSYGNLCLGMESIEFLSSDQKEYYIGFEGNDTKFIRAIENIFTIEDLKGK